MTPAEFEIRCNEVREDYPEASEEIVLRCAENASSSISNPAGIFEQVINDDLAEEYLSYFGMSLDDETN